MALELCWDGIQGDRPPDDVLQLFGLVGHSLTELWQDEFFASETLEEVASRQGLPFVATLVIFGE